MEKCLILNKGEDDEADEQCLKFYNIVKWSAIVLCKKNDISVV
jgi:hypothetical protein